MNHGVGDRPDASSLREAGPSGAPWAVSANAGKSQGQSPGPNPQPSRPAAIPPLQRPESLLTPTGDTLLSPHKPTVRDF